MCADLCVIATRGRARVKYVLHGHAAGPEDRHLAGGDVDGADRVQRRVQVDADRRRIADVHGRAV